MVIDYPPVGRRVILGCVNGLSYAGVITAYTPSPRGEPAVVVELDSSSGFSVLCPLPFVASLREVPIAHR
jgi:hypothetical protein